MRIGCGSSCAARRPAAGRSSTGWCTMASCGNREKARRFRAHRQHAA
ncbi:MAG: hypothetical protein E6J12_00430 [Chloroflexi bacterium]|nr:MAG: hypothetical protein E6J12_00430 [Chloroflexota bacterium]